MKTALYQRARAAFSNSLHEGKLNPSLVREQIGYLESFSFTERLKLLQIYRTLVQKKVNEETILVYVASAFDEAEKAQLERLLKDKFGKEKEIVYQTDPKLIGGIRVKQKDNLFDYSIAGKLEQIKEAFV